MPTMKDVAARAGVAVSTVSRILNASGYGSQETRSRVLAASSALGYLPSLRARGLRQSRTMTVGVAVPDLGNPVFLEYVRGVEHTADQAGYAVTICDGQASVEVQARQLGRLFADRVDGLVVIPPILSRDGVEPFLRAGVPVAPLAELDARTRARMHIEATLPAMLEALHLLQAGGHERIAYVTRRTPMREASLLGWVDARVQGLRKVGFEFEERFILRVDTTDDCRAAVRRLETAGERPTAYVISPYGLAPRMLAAIYDSGLSTATRTGRSRTALRSPSSAATTTPRPRSGPGSCWFAWRASPEGRWPTCHTSSWPGARSVRRVRSGYPPRRLRAMTRSASTSSAPSKMDRTRASTK